MRITTNQGPRTTDARAGFTLVELVVSIAVVAILLALLLPAVQSARESARVTQCRSNLKQLGLAMENHLSTYHRFPSNGWGYLWIGDPDRGTDRHQPGGWIYNILPFLDQGPLRELGRGQASAQKRSSLADLIERPLVVANCPSRPDGLTGPANPSLVWWNADVRPTLARTDYAVNEGDYITDTDGGPQSLAEGDSPSYPWRDVTQATGICFLRSELTAAHVSDGFSQTYLIGEKYVSRGNYNTFDDYGHDATQFSGVDVDINRWVIDPPAQDAEPIQERRFGSVHSGGCYFVFCDGSVRSISYGIHYEVHGKLGNRKDGQVVEVPGS